jgi:hypothetical protein
MELKENKQPGINNLALSRILLMLQHFNNLALALLPQHLVRHGNFFSPAAKGLERAAEYTRVTRQSPGHLLSSPPKTEEFKAPPGVVKTPGVRPPVKEGKVREGVGTDGVWKCGLEG